MHPSDDSEDIGSTSGTVGILRSPFEGEKYPKIDLGTRQNEPVWHIHAGSNMNITVNELFMGRLLSEILNIRTTDLAIILKQTEIRNKIKQQIRETETA